MTADQDTPTSRRGSAVDGPRQAHTHRSDPNLGAAPAPMPPERRDPGQTGHRPGRPVTVLRDPALLAQVLHGLRRLPGTSPAGPPK
ncbi:MAG TPA: hypothetical protein VGS19_24640 [Streptosporangiaceae bacterium]|nr:hypothetical protein [Streptosporangiaceae bacterium]